MSDPSWDTYQERMRHSQALYWVGEWAVFFLMWHLLDFDAGLVGRCKRCNSTELEKRITEVYEQPRQNKCPDCFGTNFEGGYRARIIRPAIFTDVDESEKPGKRGMTHPAQANMETTVDFRLREGDFVVRADNTRWQAATPRRTMLRTGFGHPSQPQEAISYNNAPVKLEDRTSVAYLLPAPNVGSVLNVRSHVPLDFSSFEQLRGPLIPPSFLS